MVGLALAGLLWGCSDKLAETDEDPFADVVVSFTPGENAGSGQDDYPDVVLGPPQGQGPNGGSLHVLSLGRDGQIVLGFDDVPIVDGPGVDVLVFENAFPGLSRSAKTEIPGLNGRVSLRMLKNSIQAVRV